MKFNRISIVFFVFVCIFCLQAVVCDVFTANAAGSEDSERANAYFEEGLAKIKSKEYGEAKHKFDMAIKLNPVFAEAYYHRAIMHSNMGHDKEPLQDLKKAEELGYKDAPAMIQKMQKNKQLIEAIGEGDTARVKKTA